MRGEMIHTIEFLFKRKWAGAPGRRLLQLPRGLLLTQSEGFGALILRKIFLAICWGMVYK